MPLALLSGSSLLAGCGGGTKQQAPPRIGKPAAAQLVALAQKVERDAPTDGCAAQRDIAALTAKAHELVATGRVPLRLRAHLLVGVQAVAADAPACAPPAPTPTPQPAPKHPALHKHPKPPKPRDHGPHGHGHGHDHGD